VQLARPTPKTTGTKRTRPQAKHQDESDEDDDVEVRKPVKVNGNKYSNKLLISNSQKSVVGRPGQLIPRAASNELVQHQNVAGASSIARCFNMAMNACAQSTHSNLVRF
jgi:hypothetical protein